jgi:hypothetical protein
LLENDDVVAHLVSGVRRALGTWPGEPVGQSGLIRVLNKSGHKTPLIWCFNDSSEPGPLAAALGTEQPLLILRSAHGLIDPDLKEQCEVHLSSIYAHTVFADTGAARLSVGGNCQGSRIALMLANTLLQLKADVMSVFVVEPAFMIPYSRRVMLMPGSKYSEINPIFRYANPQLAWRRYFRDYRVAAIQGGHGEYFGAENVGSLAEIISSELDAALKLPRLRLDEKHSAVDVEIKVTGRPEHWRAGAVGLVELQLTGGSGGELVVGEETGITVSFRWDCPLPFQDVFRPSSGFPSRRLLRPGEVWLERFSVQAPALMGRYTLVVQLCQEGVSYFGGQARVSVDLS